jgi:hypothetical protein
MRRIAPLALAALLAACAGSPTSADPAARSDSGLVGPGAGRSEDTGNIGSGCCRSQSSGLVGPSGGRAEQDAPVLGSGGRAEQDGPAIGSGGGTLPPDTVGGPPVAT